MPDPAGRLSPDRRRNVPDRHHAQRRVNRVRAFREELDALKSAGVVELSAQQDSAIARYHETLLRDLASVHDVDRTEREGQLSRAMQIASFLAAVALTAAVYSLVSRFWGQLDLPMQATLLCAFPLMSLVGVELSAHRERTLYIASIFALVAYGTYWLAVGALSDLVNIPITPPAIWGGALFGVALALPYGFRLVFGIALVAFLVALAGSVFQAAGVPWTAAPEFPEPITAAALLLVFTAPGFGAVYPAFAPVTRGVALAIGFLGLLLLSTSGVPSLLPTPDDVSALIYQGVLLVVCVVALVIAVRRQMKETLYIAATALTLFLLTRFVDWFWEALPRYVFFLLLAAIAFAWLLVLGRLRRRVDRPEVA